MRTHRSPSVPLAIVDYCGMGKQLIAPSSRYHIVCVYRDGPGGLALCVLKEIPTSPIYSSCRAGVSGRGGVFARKRVSPLALSHNPDFPFVGS